MSVIEAAGVILFRRDGDALHFLLLESARHGTWGFPKGHRKEHETLEACAYREVAEETGGLSFRLVPGFREAIRYNVQRATGAALKEVTYLLGEVTDGEAALSSEHSCARWADAGEAMRVLQHEQHRQLLLAAHAWLERGS